MLCTRTPSFVLALLLVSGGAALADHLSYRLRVSAPSTPAVGQASPIYLRVYRQDGALVKRFDDLHTQPMHLIVVSQDLEDFQHVHPRLSPLGYLGTRLTFARAQPYTLFAEYDPAGAHAGERTIRSTLRPTGAQPVPASLDPAQAFDGEVTRRLVRGTTRVSLVGAMTQRLRAGVAASLHVQVDDTTGAPAALQSYMGMPAHAIVVSEDLAQFLHLHGMPMSGGMTGAVDGGHGGHGGHGSTTPSNDPVAHLTVHATFPRAGLYKLWVQVQRAGRVVTVPFVVRVA